MTQDRPKIHPKWISITLLSRWGWKNGCRLLRRQFFHGIYSVFCTSHIPKATCNIAPKIQELSYHAGKTRFFYANASPQTCARNNFSCNLQCFFAPFQHRFWPPKVCKSPSPKSSFYCNLQCFLHISNTQITLPPHPPMAPYVGRSWVLCWAILALSWGHLGTMLGFVGSSWAYVGPAWDYVGRSWVLCWAILALCWPILGHVARCSNLTPCNSPQRAVFTVIYSVFCTFPTPILTPKSLQSPCPPHPPHACRRKRLSVSNAFRHQSAERN